LESDIARRIVDRQSRNKLAEDKACAVICLCLEILARAPAGGLS
jgi:hypothetical protein